MPSINYSSEFLQVGNFTNQPIDSPQDLSLYLGKSRIVGLTTCQLAYDSSSNLWKLDGKPVTDVKDSVTSI